jgi:hypothetical protein
MPHLGLFTLRNAMRLPKTIMAMNIGSSTGVNAALNALTGVEDKRAALQISMLKKSLDSQQQMAADLLKLLEGKGQQLDLRV